MSMSPSEPLSPPSRGQEPILFEFAWEVCNKLGGIYTVVRSKAPAMVERWRGRYFLVGPYIAEKAGVEFEPTTLVGPVGDAVKQLRDHGVGAHIGRWLVTGRPYVVLLNYLDVFHYLGNVKNRLRHDHGIDIGEDQLVNDVVAFGECVRRFLELLAPNNQPVAPMIAHFHEWMGGAAIPMLRRQSWPGALCFTTHATTLGRYLASCDPWFYDKLPQYNPDHEARRFNVETQYKFERAAAHGSHVFTTVSEVTAMECRQLLGLEPHFVTPNGINIQRFAALHEFQNLHKVYKDRIHEFTLGHFFPSYSFDLDKTLYFFTSGRYEPRNKGYDLTVEALARLNAMLKSAGSDMTVVFFIITQRPFRSINVTALQSSAQLREFHEIGDAVKEQIGHGLFMSAARGDIPNFNSLVDDYWLLRLRRVMHAWQRKADPVVCTHDLIDEHHDVVLNQIRQVQLFNREGDRVKIIYHPDFITSTNPLLGLEYDQFVRGCHLGVFPSYYEPWGYTPLESIALGVPALTSDLAGFGSYVQQVQSTDPEHADSGLYLLNRRQQNWEQSAQALAEAMFGFTQKSRRERIAIRNKVENFSLIFDWSNLCRHYHDAHRLALEKAGLATGGIMG